MLIPSSMLGGAFITSSKSAFARGQNVLGAHRLEERRAARCFWLLAFAHGVVWFCVGWFTQGNLPLDAVEMVSWGQHRQWGYHKHPPLPAWLVSLVSRLTGDVAAVYLTSQLLTLTTFWAVWRLAKQMVSPWLALTSVVVLEGCYYYNYTTADLNHTIATRPMWALAILFLYEAHVKNRWYHWVLAGIFIGLGLLGKYYMALLVLSMLTLPFFAAESRAKLKQSGPYLTCLIASLVVLPHVVWVCSHDFCTINYALQRSQAESDTWLNHIYYPLRFIASQLGACIPILLLLWPLRNRIQLQHCALNELPFDLKYLLIVFCGPIMLYLLCSFILGIKIHSMWGGPLFSFAGLLAIRLFANHITPLEFQRVLRTSIAVGLIAVVALTSRNLLGLTIRGKPSRIHFPGKAIAENVNKSWSRHRAESIPIIGGDEFLAGTIAIQSAQNPLVYANLSPTASPGVSGDHDMNRSGGVILWKADREGVDFPRDLQQRFPGVIESYVETFHHKDLLSQKPLQLGIAIIAPEDSPGRNQWANLSSAKRQ